MAGQGSILVLEEMLARGDPAFVDALRRFCDADQLGGFASKWFHDRRPIARQFLLEYLNRPLNAFRHEALVKRLFKLAEKAGDDEVLAGFLVLFDRSVRRVKRKRGNFEQQTFSDRATAVSAVQAWEAQGFDHVLMNEWRNRFQVYGHWSEEVLYTPQGTSMPRGQERMARNPRTGETIPSLMTKIGWPGPIPRTLDELPEPFLGRLLNFRLFSIHTRNYLRRRAWRYFRRLAKRHPERYVAAVSSALKHYEDRDVADGLALIDNWGLIHILFHYSPVLVAKTNGWRVAEGHSLGELAPAPAYEALWKQAPRALVDLLKQARCRPVRQWAVRMIRRDPAAVFQNVPLEELLELLSHQDTDVVLLAAEALRGAPGLRDLPLERWLRLIETPNETALEILCELMVANLRPEQVTLEQAVQLALARPLPVARLGLTWLRAKQPQTEAEAQALLGLAKAQAEPLRPEMVRWARQVLSASPYFQPLWVLEFLDGRFADVRAEGWTWFREEPRSRDDVEIWRRLLESPYDDVRLKLVAELEARVAKRELALAEHAALDPELLRFLWAAVLLNIHRGNRAKPLAVQQVIRRLERRPAEAPLLLPILSVALRSIRGPEWRAGLAGVVQLVERNAAMEPMVRAVFPELQLA